MRIFTGVCALIVLWLAITTGIPHAPAVQPCTDEWFSYLGSRYFDISDGEGHGPDLNDEWLNTFERKARLPETYRFPKQQRCELIQRQLEHKRYIINQQLGLTISF